MTFDSETRCLQIWQILIASARERRTIRYKDISHALNCEVPAITIGHSYLDRILAFCRSRGHPDVTVIVVNADTGRPGYYTGDDWDKDREKVYNTNWFAVVPPTREDFPNPTP